MSAIAQPRGQDIQTRALAGVLGAGRKKARSVDPDHFFPTPAKATEALLQHRSFGSLVKPGETIHECACGNGAMAQVIEDYGYPVIATDLVDRGYGEAPVNFLSETQRRADVIITNPAFRGERGVAYDFVRHALVTLRARVLCLLLPTGYLQAGSTRSWIAYERRPVWKLKFGWRVDFTGEDQSPMDVAWFIWRTSLGRRPDTRLDTLSRPMPREFFLSTAE